MPLKLGQMSTRTNLLKLQPSSKIAQSLIALRWSGPSLPYIPIRGKGEPITWCKIKPSGASVIFYTQCPAINKNKLLDMKRGRKI